MRNGFEALVDLKETYFWRFRCHECDPGRALVWPLTVVFLLTVRIIFQIQSQPKNGSHGLSNPLGITNRIVQRPLTFDPPGAMQVNLNSIF